jgi:hypothetical protein
LKEIQTIGEPNGFQFQRILDRAVCERDLELSDGTIIWDGRIIVSDLSNGQFCVREECEEK